MAKQRELGGINLQIVTPDIRTRCNFACRPSYISNRIMVRFSILMPVYNRERYVRQAVDSVLSQTFKDYELFAIDDGSSDRSGEILASYGDKISLLRQENRGPEAARNYAAVLAHGEYLVFLDSDDYFFPFALETFDKVIRHFNSPPLVLGAYEFSQDHSHVPASTPVEVFLYENFGSKTRPVGTSCIILRKSVFDAVGGQRKDTTATTWDADDTHLLLKVSSYGPCIVIRRPATTFYRLHGENSIKNLNGVVNGLLRVAQGSALRRICAGHQCSRVHWRTRCIICLSHLLARRTSPPSAASSDAHLPAGCRRPLE